MAAKLKLKHRGIGELLGLYGEILGELREREVIRSTNAPTGDYAEWLVQRALTGTLQPNSNKSADLVSRGKQIQIKARVLSEPEKAGQRQLSPFRSFDFDAAVIVLFDETYGVLRAVRMAVAELEAAASRDEYVNASRVIAKDALLDRGRDITDKLRQAAKLQDG